MIETAYDILFGIAFVVLALCILALIIRSILGPGVTERVICVNMIGTTVTSVFAMLAVLMKELWLYDICLIYVLVSFLSVVILSKVFMNRTKNRLL